MGITARETPVFTLRARAQSPAMPRLVIDEALARAVPGEILKSLPIQKDRMVLAYLPAWNFGHVDNIGVGNNDGGVRTYFDWAELDTALTAPDSKQFWLALYARKTNSHATQGPIGVYKVLEEWTERPLRIKQPTTADEPSAKADYKIGDGWKLINIRDLVRACLKSKSKVHGVVVRFVKGARKSELENWSDYKMVSRVGVREWEGERPTLLIMEPKK